MKIPIALKFGQSNKRHQYVALTILAAVALILVVFGFYLKHQNNLKREEVLVKQIHFHVYLREKVSDIQPLSDHQQFIGNFNLTLFDAIQDVQNDFFDSVQIDGRKQQVAIRLVIPEDIKDREVVEYIDFQALNYVLILNRLIPNNSLSTIKFVAFRRGIYTSEIEQVYDFTAITKSKIANYNADEISKYIIKN